LIGSAIFAGLTIVTDRPNDRQTTYVALRTYAVLQCGLKIGPNATDGFALTQTM